MIVSLDVYLNSACFVYLILIYIDHFTYLFYIKEGEITHFTQKKLRDVIGKEFAFKVDVSRINKICVT